MELKRVKSKKAHKFDLDDHIFSIKIENIKNKRPKLIDIMNDLDSALEEALKYLQSIYLPDKEHHIYICFEQQSADILGATTGIYCHYIIKVRILINFFIRKLFATF